LFIGSKHVGTAGSSNPQNSNNEVPSLDEPKPPVEKAKAKAGPSPVQKAKTKATPPEQEDLDAQIERLNREAFPPAERTGTIGAQARNTDLERQNVETKARMGRDRAEVAAKAARKQAAIDKKDAVSALGLVALYESNEVNADTLAKGHLIVVEGTIDRIAKDIFNHPYVTVGRSKHGITSIQCAFSKEDEPQLAALIPGQHIYLKGTVKGKMMNVLMDGCKLLNVK
jgi:L-lactate utilization protein LutC